MTQPFIDLPCSIDPDDHLTAYRFNSHDELDVVATDEGAEVLIVLSRDSVEALRDHLNTILEGGE